MHCAQEIYFEMKTNPRVFSTQRTITASYLKALDNHLADLLQGRATEMLEIKGIAALLHIHPTHLSNTIRTATGQSACYFYEQKILDIAKTMLRENQLSISDIASLLTYDPSNFTKFFKHFTGKTPKQFREEWLANSN